MSDGRLAACVSFVAAGAMLVSVLGCVAHPTATIADAKSVEHNAEAPSGPMVDYNAKPPFSAVELWSKILALLNEHNGSVTKERFEQLFGVHFVEVRYDSDVTVHFIREHRDWYISANLVSANDGYRPPVPERKRAHVKWYIGWHLDTFGDPAKQECLTAARARADLLASGWTSPWSQWGLYENKPAAPATATDPYPSLIDDGPGPPAMEPLFFFVRQADDAAGHGGRLPRGQLFSSGDLPESCITGIQVLAAP